MRKWSFLSVMLCVGAVCFVLFLLLAYAVREDDSPRDKLILASVLTAGMLLIFLLTFIGHFLLLRKLTRDRSDRSIMPLFDNGFTTDVASERNKVYFASSSLMGHISGIPVTVTVNTGGKHSDPAITFCFAPLTHVFKGTGLERSITFDLSRLSHKPKEDIKPAIRQFVDEFTAKGYYYAETGADGVR